MAPSRLAPTLALLSVMAGGVHTQQPPPPPPAQTPAKAPDDLDRIKAALKRPNTIILTDTQVRGHLQYALTLLRKNMVAQTG